MRLKEVTLTNFRSYKGVHTFKPRSGASFILGSNSDNGYSSNGGGKTSLLSAIAWGLYGELATGSAKDAVIHYGELEVAVEIKFEGLVVRRSKKRAKPEILEFFSEEYGTWIREDLDQTQDKLDKYVGVSKDLFYNAFWLDNASKTVQFLFKRPAERLQALQDLLGEGFFAKAKKAATAKRQAIDTQISKIESDLPWLEKQEKAHISRVFDLEQQLIREESRVQKAEQENKSLLLSQEEDLNKLVRCVEVLVFERDQLAERLNISPEELIRNCALLEAQIRQTEDKFQKQYTGKADKTCPTCLRPLEAEDKKVLEEEKNKLFKDLTRLKKALDTEKKKKDEVQKEKKKIDKISSEILEAKTMINIKSKTIEENKKRVVVEDKALLSRLRGLIEKERENLETTKREQKEKKSLLESLKERVPMYRFWEEGFGSKGIQNLLLDDVRGLLDQFTRNYLAHFSGEVLRVVYPKSDKGFEILVSYRGKETPISNLSRGEVGRANMAVLLALRKMLLFMNRSKIDFIVLDDAISDLDESGTQSIVDLVEVLSKEVGSVFVTLPQHLPTIKQELVVRVSKKDGASCIL